MLKKIVKIDISSEEKHEKFHAVVYYEPTWLGNLLGIEASVEKFFSQYGSVWYCVPSFFPAGLGISDILEVRARKYKYYNNGK